MKLKYYFLLLILPVAFSCSTGKKALQKGDYFSALSKAVERLKSSPDNKNATKVLRDGYPLALQWTQEEMDLVLSANNAFKWENAIGLMEQINQLSAQIRSTPAARKIIQNPESYTSEITMATEKAAEARYLAGLAEMDQNTRESAREAFHHFIRADQLINGYRDVSEKIRTAKDLATVKVVLEAVVVNTQRYRLSSEFFYNQVFEFVNNRFPRESLVNFYSPKQAEDFGVKHPDFIVQMEFFDFSVGNLVRTEKEEELTNKVKIETKDTTRVEYKTYKAKLKTFTDEVISGGRLSYKVIDFQTNNLLRDNLIPGSFTWVNRYAMFVGDKEALTSEQMNLTRKKAVPLPPEQDLFVEFTKPIYDQLTSQLDQFFRRYR